VRWFATGIVAGLLLSAGLSCSAPQVREICGNGIDDDGNGQTDCDDRDCAGQNGCPALDAGWYGECAHCGGTCDTQATCLAQRWDFDTPLPECLGGYCAEYNTPLQLHVELDTKAGWAGLGVSPYSVNTRFVKKTALDGSPVTCATLQAAASSKLEADASQIERSGRFQLQGYDVRRLTNPQLGQGVTLSYVNVSTGADYIIWAEFWAGLPDSNTRLPTGNRLGWGCWEMNDALHNTDLSPIVAADHCPTPPDTSPTCRTFHLLMPGPQP